MVSSCLSPAMREGRGYEGGESLPVSSNDWGGGRWGEVGGSPCKSPVTREGPGGVGGGSLPNSKHWFTTSFLQPLPYLVTS